MKEVQYSYILDEKGPWGISLKSWLDHQSLALMVIDMQNYMTNARYSGKWSAAGSDNYYYNRLENIVLPNIGKLLSKFRNLNLKVIYLRIASARRDLSDVPGLTRKRLSNDLHDCKGKSYHLYHDEKASQIDERIKPRNEDIVISKTSSGAFNCSEIESVLRQHKISSIIFTGGLTEACVSSTLRAAFDKGYLCILAEDACVSSKIINHDVESDIIRSYFGWVTSTEELLSLIG